jgi:hypothetical protein
MNIIRWLGMRSDWWDKRISPCSFYTEFKDERTVAMDVHCPEYEFVPAPPLSHMLTEISKRWPRYLSHYSWCYREVSSRLFSRTNNNIKYTTFILLSLSPVRPLSYFPGWSWRVANNMRWIHELFYRWENFYEITKGLCHRANETNGEWCGVQIP